VIISYNYAGGKGVKGETHDEPDINRDRFHITGANDPVSYSLALAVDEKSHILFLRLNSLHVPDGEDKFVGALRGVNWAIAFNPWLITY
jgi:hypothetical protein